MSHSGSANSSTYLNLTIAPSRLSTVKSFKKESGGIFKTPLSSRKCYTSLRTSTLGLMKRRWNTA
jgi:hypothetical protein